MLCPACKAVNLSMVDRQGIEIDCCPDCRGIWLDRGELESLIERAKRPMPGTTPAAPSPRDYSSAYHGDHHGEHSHHGHSPKRRKSLLGDLFDF